MFYDAAGQLFGAKISEGAPDDPDDPNCPDVQKPQTGNYYEYDGVGNVIRSRMAPADVTQPDQVDLYDTSQSTTPIFDTEDHDFITLPLVIDLGAVVSIVVRETGTSSIPKIALQSPSGIWQNFPDEDGDGTISIPTFVANERHLDATPWNPDGTRWKLIVYGPDDTTNNEFYLDVFVDGFSALGSIDYSYDLAGNLREVIESPNGPDSVPHDYDDDVSVGLGAITPYTYDALHRLTELRQSGTNVADKRVDFDYYDDSQFDTITRYSDLTGTNQVVASTYLYDDIGRLTDLQHAFGSTLDYGYSYDAAGRITQMTMPDASDNDYTYDNTNQLLTATLTNETYGYDDNGNRDTGGFTVDDNNRMDSDGTYTYAYDDEGNRTQRFIWADDGDGVIEAGEKSSITTYDWDHRNRLTEVTLPSGEVIDYTYDYQNRLVERDVTGGTADHAYYVHQGDNIALELDGLQSGDLTHRYLWGAAVDQLLADDQIGGELLWPLGDHEQTIRDVIDSSGQTRIHREYDSFGKIITETKYDTAGTVVPDSHAEAVDELFAYTGRQLDKDTGLQNNLNRWYDPLVGRWLNEDPSGFNAGDMNLYRYVGNNPVNNIDPSGLDWSGFSSSLPGFQDYGSSIMFGSTFQSPISGSVPRVDPPGSGYSSVGNLGGVQFALAMGANPASSGTQWEQPAFRAREVSWYEAAMERITDIWSGDPEAEYNTVIVGGREYGAPAGAHDSSIGATARHLLHNRAFPIGRGVRNFGQGAQDAAAWAGERATLGIMAYTGDPAALRESMRLYGKDIRAIRDIPKNMQQFLDTYQNAPDYMKVRIHLEFGGEAGAAIITGQAVSRGTSILSRTFGPRTTVPVRELYGRQLKTEFTGNKIKRFRRQMQAQGGYGDFPPIKIAIVDGKKVIVDGHHRARAAGAAGIKNVPVEIVDPPPNVARKYFNQAAEASESFGLPF